MNIYSDDHPVLLAIQIHIQSYQSQHAVCHCQESGKTATQLPQGFVIKWIYNIVLFEEERGMFILHHF